jgi:hypothetical protein
MWKIKLWKNPVKILLHNDLWRAVDISHTPCGKKVLAALREIPLFHISFLYYC